MKYDVIVIGAGSAGGTVASRLAESPERSVLLLEAGPDYPDLEHLPDDLKHGYVPAASEMGAPPQLVLFRQGLSSSDRAGERAPGQGDGRNQRHKRTSLPAGREDYDRWVS